MSFCRLAWRCAVAASLCLWLSGCGPFEDSQLDEQKESHFLAGQSRVNSLDYRSAVEEYEKSLEVMPHSASAHFELGWLCEEKTGDPAAAIYHYQRFLEFQPNSNKADLVKSRINNCKMELAKTVSAIGPQPAAAPRDWDKVLAENRDLKAQLAQLRDSRPANPPAATAVPMALITATVTNAPREPAGAVTAEAPRTAAAASPPGRAGAMHPTAAASTRTYAVKAGDNPAAVARKFGVPLNALLAANPQVRPTHMLVGQVLNIPAQ